jgi:hypothetical protein
VVPCIRLVGGNITGAERNEANGTNYKKECLMNEKVNDYIRRVQLAIDGYDRQENVSTWVVKEHLKESISEPVRTAREPVGACRVAIRQDVSCLPGFKAIVGGGAHGQYRERD